MIYVFKPNGFTNIVNKLLLWQAIDRVCGGSYISIERRINRWIFNGTGVSGLCEINNPRMISPLQAATNLYVLAYGGLLKAYKGRK